MSKLIINNNRCAKIDEADKSFFKRLNDLLSFKMEGIEYSPAYKNYGWDGITRIINKQKEFPLGLVSTVQDFYRDNGVELVIEDNRAPVEFEPPLDITTKLKELGKTPRDYQLEMAELMLTNRRGIIRAATGAGKSIALALMIAKLNKPTNLYVVGLSLLQQMHDLFSLVFDEPIGMVGGGICEIHRINIVSVWTLGRALDISDKDMFALDESVEKETFDESNKYKIIRMLDKAKAHFLDECHLASCNTIRIISENIDSETLIGVSGTPMTGKEEDILITGILGDIIMDVNAEQLINAKILVPPTIKFVTTPASHTGSDTYQQMYKDFIVENPIRNKLIVTNTKMLVDKGYPTLVLFKQIKHGNILLELLQEANIKCEMLSGKDSLKRRADIKDKLESGEINVILASTIMDIGVDIPALSALVLAGSGKSAVKTLQRVGRVIRNSPGKKRAIVIDFYDPVRWLKNHSKARYQIYKSEKGFNLLPLKV